MSNKIKKQYLYDYPEQRKLSKQLRRGDRMIIAEKTGYSFHTILQMCNGQRKMNPKIKRVIEDIILVNEQISKIIYDKKKQND